MNDLNIEKRKVSDLKSYPGNPRKISSEMLERLKKSISEFGIVVDLKPEYIDIVLARWENFTGKKAKKID